MLKISQLHQENRRIKVSLVLPFRQLLVFRSGREIFCTVSYVCIIRIEEKKLSEKDKTMFNSCIWVQKILEKRKIINTWQRWCGRIASLRLNRVNIVWLDLKNTENMVVSH